MKLLIAANEAFNRRNKTVLTATAVAGSSVVLSVANTDNFAVNNYVVVGIEGSQQAEMCKVTAVTGETITVATLALTHLADEPVVQYRYNQRKFWGCTTSTGVFTELTAYGSPAQIMVNDPNGTTLEYTGTEGYLYFVATYYNSTTTESTDLTSSTPSLADDSGRYTSLNAIRRKAGLTNNPFITDERLENKRKQAENEINSALFAQYVLPLSEVPALVSQIAELLAAGYIDYEEFGSEGTGVKWLGEGRSILRQITDGTRRLLDSTYAELTRVTNTNVLNGYPDDTEPCGPTFSTSDRY